MQTLMNRLRLALLLALTCTTGISPSVQGNELPALSVCELMRGGAQLDGRTVHVKAVYETDRSHFAALVDGRCRRVHVDLWYPIAQPRDRSFEEFASAIEGELTDSRLRRFDVEIVGRFSWDGRPEPMPRSANGLRESRGRVDAAAIVSFRRLEPKP